MDSEKVIKRDNEYVLHTYNRNPIVLEKGHGLRAAGPEGQQYLDFTSGIGVNSLGYCDLDWAEAVSEQAHKLQHTSNLYYTAPCGKLAKKLCKRTGMSKVFFGNSGAEANEGAIKAARKYSVDHYRKDRTTVITLVNSFHGRTIATLTATGQEVFHNYFGPFNEGFQYVKAGDLLAQIPKGEGKGLPPVHLWHPAFCGDIDMRIGRDGTWYYMGTPIGRKPMVKLFSSIIRRDGDKYVLVTPVEMVGIQVDDAPFVAISLQVEGEGDAQVLRFITNVDDEEIGRAHV